MHYSPDVNPPDEQNRGHSFNMENKKDATGFASRSVLEYFCLKPGNNIFETDGKGADLMIDDRMTKGMLAGMAGAVVQNIYAYLAKTLGLTDTLYLNVARAVLFNQNFTGPLAVFVGILGQLTIDGFWGIIFTFLIRHTSSRNYMLKGVFFGCGVWFLVRVIIAKILGLPVLGKNIPQVALFFFTGACLFGITVAMTLKLLDVKKIGS